MGIGLHESAYTFLFNHAKAVVSAAVRASVMGPYKAQGLLAGGWLRGEIENAMEANWGRSVEEAGQGVVMLDLWVGRHELLYSRIFNS
jgi:urease accessory protein